MRMFGIDQPDRHPAEGEGEIGRPRVILEQDCRHGFDNVSMLSQEG